MTTLFKHIEKNDTFFKNGNTYKKVSSRTAMILLPKRFEGKVFYFQNELAVTKQENAL
jgi:hypothetical protein